MYTLYRKSPLKQDNLSTKDKMAGPEGVLIKRFHCNICLYFVGGYQGDVYLLVKLLLPTAGKKRVYNLQSKQIVKLLSQVMCVPVAYICANVASSDDL